jgi:hypothetical protein
MRKKYFGKGKEEKELLDRLREISRQDKTPEEVQAAIDSLLASDGIVESEESSSEVYFSTESSSEEIKKVESKSESVEVKVESEESNNEEDNLSSKERFDEHGNQVLFYESEQKDFYESSEHHVLSEIESDSKESSSSSSSSSSFDLSFESDELELAYESDEDNLYFDEKDDDYFEKTDTDLNFMEIESELEGGVKRKKIHSSEYKDESSESYISESKNESEGLLFESHEITFEDDKSEYEESKSEQESEQKILFEESYDEHLESSIYESSEYEEESYDDLASFLLDQDKSESSIEEIEIFASMNEESSESISKDKVHSPKKPHSITQKNRGGNDMSDFDFEKEVESKDGFETEFEVCEAVKKVEKTVKLKDQIRILKTRIKIEDICPNSCVAVAVLLVDEHGKTIGIRGGEFIVPSSGDDHDDCDNTCTNLKVRFTFVVPEKNICDARKLNVKVITHYTELPKK